MPGVVGFMGKGLQGEARATIVRKMLGTMTHEKFYRVGTIEFPELDLAVGWTVLEGSSSLCLPLWNAARDICLIFSGEHFAPHDDDYSHRVEGQADSLAGLIAAYEEKGASFLEQLNGCFQGVLIDLQERMVFLFNDRYGSCRIYCHENADGVYFSSEAKAILKVAPATRELDLQGLGEFLSCSAVLEDRSLFRQVSVVPAGSCWKYSPQKGLQKGSYFDKRKWEEQPVLSETEFYDRLQNTWRSLLGGYLSGREAVALSLTGGVDSRMILACAPAKPGTLPCYTFGGKYRDSKDVVLARDLASIAGQKHYVLSIGEDFLSQFSRLAEQAIWTSDGGMDITGTIDLYVGRKAREIAPVRVTGTCGGEILRRLVAFKPISTVGDLFEPDIATSVQNASETYVRQRSDHPVSFTAFKQTAWHLAPKFALERSQLTLRMPFYDNRLVALSYQAPSAFATSNEPALRIIAEANPELAKTGTDRGVGTTRIPVVSGLRRVVQEAVFKTEYYFDYGMPQWLSRVNRMLSPLQMERNILGRHKFHHFRVFYRDELSGFVQDALLSPGARSGKYVPKKRAREIVEAHTSGSANYTWELHKLLTLEMIERTLLSLN